MHGMEETASNGYKQKVCVMDSVYSLHFITLMYVVKEKTMMKKQRVTGVRMEVKLYACLDFKKKNLNLTLN